MRYADIILPIERGPGEKRLTYSIPETLKGKIIVGSTVCVPLRHRQETGIVVELHSRALDFAVKEILTSKETEALFNPTQIALAEWMSEYYLAPLYAIFKIMLPGKVLDPENAIPYAKVYERTELSVTGKLGTQQDRLIKKFDQDKVLHRADLPDFSVTTLKSLVSKGLIQETAPHIRAADLKIPQRAIDSAKRLSPTQQAIFNTIRTGDQPRFLIHGVTGSGKTEIYLQLVQAAMAEGKQAIVLVPEISLTPQLIDYFHQTVGKGLAVLHSQLAEGEREREWWRIRTGHARVVIGSRSAIFAPVQELGLIVIDEEHEWSYKQEKTPHYHARDIAFKLGEFTGAKVILGSATPSIETMHATTTGHIQYCSLPERIHPDQKLPTVALVDMRSELHKKNFSIFSELLHEKLTETFALGKQAILFLNRRGNASCVLCRECGQALNCPGCEVSMTHHKSRTGSEQLICHHCDFRQSMPPQCPNCGSVAIKFVGLGTERVERELQLRFPTLRILRADRDTTTRKGSFKDMYYALKNNEADVLIGTQMVSKGLDLPNMRLVGVMLADIGLHLPDFRAAERNFQILTQVAGRAGRSTDPGEVVIQTYNPDHISLQCAAQHDYDRFYQQEIQSRQQLGYPPFARLLKLTYKHIEHKKCSEEAERVEKELKSADEHYKISCAPAFIPRQHGHYRYHVFIQGKDPQGLLSQWLKTHTLKPGWTLDVDPILMS